MAEKDKNTRKNTTNFFEGTGIKSVTALTSRGCIGFRITRGCNLNGEDSADSRVNNHKNNVTLYDDPHEFFKSENFVHSI